MVNTLAGAQNDRVLNALPLSELSQGGLAAWSTNNAWLSIPPISVTTARRQLCQMQPEYRCRVLFRSADVLASVTLAVIAIINLAQLARICMTTATHWLILRLSAKAQCRMISESVTIHVARAGLPRSQIQATSARNSGVWPRHHRVRQSDGSR